MAGKRISAGLLMYRVQGGQLQVLLSHFGGPYFKNKDEGFWSLPKGEIEPGEDLLDAAKREFTEEVGITPSGPFIALTPVIQANNKNVHAWAFKGDCDPSKCVSNMFTMEWPPKSGPRNQADKWNFLKSTGASFLTLIRQNGRLLLGKRR